MGKSPQGHDHKDRPYGTLPGRVGRIIQAFKSITMHEYTVGVKKQGGRHFQVNYGNAILGNTSSAMKRN
jgi:hypothetical protein